MKKLLLLVALIAIVGQTAPAQINYPKAELFLGYSYGNADSNVGGRPGPRPHANGWAGSLSGNLHKNLGFTADVAGHYGNLRVQQPTGRVELDYRDYQYLFGPQLTHRMEYVNVYAHGLFGVVNTKLSGGTFTLPGGAVTIPRTDVTDFAMGFGAGADAHINRRVALRFGFDYVPVHTDTKDWLSNFRAQVGFVFKFGGS